MGRYVIFDTELSKVPYDVDHLDHHSSISGPDMT